MNPNEIPLHIYFRITKIKNSNSTKLVRQQINWITCTFMMDLQNGRVKGRVLIFSCDRSKIATNRWTAIDRRMLDLTKKKKKNIPHVQGQRRNSNKLVGGSKLHLETNPIPARELGGLKQILVCTRTQGPQRDWARPASECLSVSCGGTDSSGLLRGQELWLQQTWEAQHVSPP